MRARNVFGTVAVAMLCGALGACLSEAAGKIAESLNKAADTLTNIGTDLGNGAADFNTTAGNLTQVVKDLPKEAANELRIAVEEAAGRASQAAGIQVRCSADFARKRIAEDIQHLASTFKAKALGRATPERPPPTAMVCMPVPPSVRRDRMAQTAVITWDGYDLDDSRKGSKPLSLVLHKGDGSVTEGGVGGVLSRSSNYQVVADLSRVTDALWKNADKVVLKCGDAVISEVAIEASPVAPPVTVTVPLSVWGPKVAGKCPHPCNRGADVEFDGHGPKVTWSVTVKPGENGTKIVAHISYHAIEWDTGKNRARSDYTEACGEWDEVVYTCPTGERILRIIDTPTDSGSYVDTDSNDDSGSGRLYSRYVLGGDRKGDDAGTSTKIQAPVQGKVQVEVQRGGR